MTEYGEPGALEHDLIRFKLVQARDSLEQARALLAANGDPDLVGSSVFNAMYYAVLALLLKRKVPPVTRHVSLSLFEREYVLPGLFDRRFSEALRRTSELGKGCDCEGRAAVSRRDIEEPLPLAEEFVNRSDDVISHR